MTTRSNTTSHSEWSTAPDKSFVSTKPFNLEFYQYSLTRSDAPPFTKTGSLVLHPSASLTQCPAGRVLHANGKKLIPDVNVMNRFTTPANGTIQTKKFMVGVYDPQSMLNGYIDLTSATFAVYDKNRPASDYLLDATVNVAESTALLGLGGQGSRLPAKILIGNPATDTAAGDSAVGSFNIFTPDTLGHGQARNGLIRVNTRAATPNSIILLTSANPNIAVSFSDLQLGRFDVTIRNISNGNIVNFSTTVNWLVIN